MVLVNMIVEDDDDPPLWAMRKVLAPVWRHRRLLDRKSSSNRNVIVAAGSVKKLKAPRLRMRPAIGARRLAEALSGFFFRPLH